MSDRCFLVLGGSGLVGSQIVRTVARALEPDKIVVASLFPLGVGSEPRLLREIGPGVVWVAALLASLLSLPRLFVADHADGTLEQLLLRPHPLPLLALAKVAGHWLKIGRAHV